MKIGIIGLGFVGGAIYKSFSLHQVNVVRYDKFKSEYNNFCVIKDCDIVFLALPTLYSKTEKKFNICALHEVYDKLSKINFSGIVVIKSTIEPGVSEELANKYELKTIHNPEFLTARTAFIDFHNQTHIVLGRTLKCSSEDVQMVYTFYKTYWPHAQYSILTSTETETVKLYCNTFYAVKVQLFNEFYYNCQVDGTDFDKIIQTMLKNNWINPMHTKVPGPDGKCSYGGTCFPKDTNALMQHISKNRSVHAIIKSCIEERNKIRNETNKTIDRS